VGSAGFASAGAASSVFGSSAAGSVEIGAGVSVLASGSSVPVAAGGPGVAAGAGSAAVVVGADSSFFGSSVLVSAGFLFFLNSFLMVALSFSIASGGTPGMMGGLGG